MLLIFLPEILIPACASSSLSFCMMYSAYRLNKLGDNIQPWDTPFPILNHSVVPCPVLIVASWPAYRFLRRQVMWTWTWKSLSHSLQLHGLLHGILQARILEWVAFSFPRGNSQPRDQTQVSCIASRFFTSWATREARRQLRWSDIPISWKFFHSCDPHSQRLWCTQ